MYINVSLYLKQKVCIHIYYGKRQHGVRHCQSLSSGLGWNTEHKTELKPQGSAVRMGNSCSVITTVHGRMWPVPHTGEAECYSIKEYGDLTPVVGIPLLVIYLKRCTGQMQGDYMY